MRKTFFPIVMILAALTAGASTASAASLKARQEAVAVHAVIGSPAPTIMGYTTSSGAVVLKRDSGTSRTLTPPAGCTVSAAGSFLLAGECTPQPSGTHDPRTYVVLRLDGSEVRRVTVPAVIDLNPANPFMSAPALVGGQWFALYGGCYKCTETTEAVNWRTGETREFVDENPNQVLDLDAPGLTAPLCAPLTRKVPPGGVEDEYLQYEPTFNLRRATIRAGYVLLADEIRQDLHRCGTSAAVKLPGGFTPQQLGDGWVARIVKLPRIGRHVQLLRLSDRKLYTVTGVQLESWTDGLKDLHFTHGRLFFPSRGQKLHSVALPTR